MQKFDIPCISTGEFARLCNTNKRTLIHYDEIGLFAPAYTDEKGYRYYTENQCDVFFTITCLKDIGMPLKEIKKFIVQRNPADLKTLLLEQEIKVRQELQHLKRIQQVIQTKLELVTEGETLKFEKNCSQVFLTYCPEEYLIATPYLNTSKHDELFSALCQHIGYVNHNDLNMGHPYGAVIEVDAIKRAQSDIYAYFVTKVAEKPEKQEYLVKPEGEYAVIYLQGDYYDAEAAYEKLFVYMEQKGLQPGKYCYKEAVWDELTVMQKQEYITRISVPVYERER